MSIINDALKKVQSNLSHSDPKEPKPEPGATTSFNNFSNASDQPMPKYEEPAPVPASEPIAATAPTQPSPVAESAPAPLPNPKPTAETKGNESSLVYILGALCLLIALFAPIVNGRSLFQLITHPKGKKQTPAMMARTPSPVKAISDASTTVTQKAASIQQEISRSITNLASPNSNTNSSSSGSSRSFGSRRFTLNGILAQGDANVALIDGQVYEVGETIDNAKIVAINANSIVVEQDGQSRTVKVGQ